MCPVLSEFRIAQEFTGVLAFGRFTRCLFSSKQAFVLYQSREMMVFGAMTGFATTCQNGVLDDVFWL